MLSNIQLFLYKSSKAIKHTSLLGCIALLVSCGSQVDETIQSATQVSSKSTAVANFGNSKLLASLAATYPNGQLPSDRVAQSVRDLAQNPAVLLLTAETPEQYFSQNTATVVQTQATVADFQPVQRIQNASLYGAYFFSIYPSEVSSALSTHPNWRLEGPAFWASLATGTDLYPVHRFQNKLNGSYLYTIYDTERADIVANYSATFAYEGVAWYAQQTPGAGWSPLYRFRNKTNGTYLFSAYESEKDAIVANYPDVFALEGIGYYVRQDTPVDVPVVPVAPTPFVTNVTPNVAAIGISTVFTVTGANLPSSAILTIADVSCQPPVNNTAIRFTQVCTPSGAVGTKVITVRTAPAASGGIVINASYTVSFTNTPVPTVNSITPVSANLAQATTFTVLGANLPLTATLSIADATCNAAIGNTATSFSQICTLGGTAGSKIATVKTANNGTVIDVSRTVNATTPYPPSANLLNDTGISSSQCFQAGSDVLVSCTSAAAIALNSKQDGMIGRDVTAPAAADGKLGFSYSIVGTYPITDCVKDNVTGLIWEGKPTSGIRLNTTGYTNQNNNSNIDVSGYIATVKGMLLCGYSDWRLPTRDELQSLVDNSLANPGPTIDATWFPNTVKGWYWTSSPIVGNTYGYLSAWYVNFIAGDIGQYGRQYFLKVRLVRGSSASTSTYTVSADGQELMDAKTGLIWQRCLQGMVWSGVSCTGTAYGYSHEEALTLASTQSNNTGMAWRLPNLKELGSIVDTTKNRPAMDISVFPGTPESGGVWSSTPNFGDTTVLASGVSLFDGTTFHTLRYRSYLVRLVR